jgi:hypothetical protein
MTENLFDISEDSQEENIENDEKNDEDEVEVRRL